MESPLLAAVASRIDARHPSAHWETRTRDELRAFLPTGRFDLGASESACSVRVCTALEDCRRDEDDGLAASLAEWRRRRDQSSAVRDLVDVAVDGRVIYASFSLDDDAPDLAARLQDYVARLASFG
jgi:hypothetical protein